MSRKSLSHFVPLGWIVTFCAVLLAISPLMPLMAADGSVTILAATVTPPLNLNSDDGTLEIGGTGFLGRQGTCNAPVVLLAGIPLTLTNSSSTSITATIPNSFNPMYGWATVRLTVVTCGQDPGKGNPSSRDDFEVFLAKDSGK